MDGKIAARLAEPAVASGNIALATVLIAPGSEAQVEAIRAKADQFRGEVGVFGLERFCLGAAVCARRRGVAA